MDKQHRKVDNVEIGKGHAPASSITLDNLATVLHDVCTLAGSTRTSGQDLIASKASGQTVGPGLDPVTEIVDVTSNTPPAGDEKLAARLGLNVLEVCDAGVFGVRAEGVLLAVGRAEDEEAEADERDGTSEGDRAKRQRMNGQIACLHGIHKGNPNEIAKRKHHAKTIGGDVHGRKNSGFKPPRVHNVHGLHNSDADDTVGNVAKVAVLLSAPSTVEDDPPHHTRSQLAPLL